MNKNLYSKILVLGLSILLGTLLSFQFKNDLDESSFVSLNSIVDIKNEISKAKNEIDLLNKSIIKKKDELNKLEVAHNKGDISNVLIDEIENIMTLTGFKDVWGQGVYITVDDSEETNFSEYSQEYYDIVHDIYLTNLVNELKKAGAEAININGQRLLVTSEINCAGPVIRINKRAITNPFIIKAIGDPKKLYNAISGTNGYGTYLKDYFNLNIRTQISDYIYISKYDKEINFDFVVKSKEGE